MKVATKLGGAFGVQAAILVGVLVYHVGVTREAVSTSYELSAISSRVFAGTAEQLRRIAQLDENASKYAVTRDRGYLDKFGQISDEFDAALRRLESVTLSEPETARLVALVEAWDRFRPLAEGLPALVHAAPSGAAPDLLAQIAQRLDTLHTLTRGLGDASQEAMLARLERSASAARAAERLSWVAAAAALLLSVLVSALIIRSISESLATLKRGTHEVAEGNFRYRLDTSRSDEFAQVARHFNTMTERLAELDGMKRDFVSKVSHDLKTPLASMQETVNILLDEVPGRLTEKQRKLLLLNQQAGQRLSAMVAKLLELSRMEAGGLAPEFALHRLEPLIRHAVEQIEPAAAERKIRIAATLEAPAILLECDAERIRRVLDNLLENAIKFSPEGSAIVVTTQYASTRPDRVPYERWRALRRPDPKSGVVLTTVADCGPGVPDQDKERIFERFYQTSAGRAVHGRGVGLGLTICREIVAAHGGALWVEDRPGGGSTFCMLLPRALRVPGSAMSAARDRYEEAVTHAG